MFQIQRDDSRIAYRQIGSGTGVLLLHSTGISGAQWQDLLQAFEQDPANRVTAVAVDLFGHGASDPWPGTRPLGLADEALAALAAMAAVPGRFHLVGHSYGGAVALKLAQLAPDRVKSLTVIEPAAFHLLRDRPDDDRRLYLEIGRIGLAVSRAAASGDYQSGLSQFVDFWNGEGTWGGLSAKKRQALLRQIGPIALNFWATLTEPSRLDALVDLRMPALVIEGESSPRVTRRISQLVAQALPAVERRLIEGAGHMLPLTHPESVNSAIRDFIARIERRQPTARRLTAA